jgi:Leucine-rich repeat (LRR) protein
MTNAQSDEISSEMASMRDDILAIFENAIAEADCNPETYLESRAEPDFDSAWVLAREAVEAAKGSTASVDDALQQMNTTLRERVFMTCVRRFCDSDKVIELAAALSDDAGLVFEAMVLGVSNAWIDSLLSRYAEGELPASPGYWENAPRVATEEELAAHTAGLEEARSRIAAAAVSGARTLDLSGLSLCEVPEELYALTHLEVLDLGSSGEKEAWKSNALRLLPPALCAALPHLTHLHLDANKLRRLPVEIASLSNLVELDLRMNNVGRTGAQALAGLPNLVTLDLGGNQVDAKGAQALASLPRLASLDLEHNEIGDEGAKSLAALANLTVLNVRQNEIGPVGARALARLPALKTLDLGGNTIGLKGARALAGCVNLASLSLWGAGITAKGAESLASLVNLTSLNLGGNEIGPKGAEALASLINLTSLDLNGNDIGPEGARALSGLVNLVSLNLRENRIGDEGVRALTTLTNLTSLDLRGNFLTAEGAQTLDGLANLTSIDLGNNRIGRKAVEAPTRSSLADIPKELLDLKDKIVRNMIDYSARHYAVEDAQECGQILQTYLERVIDKTKPYSEDALMAAAKDAVLALNELNDRCDETLIETDAREYICELIHAAAASAGLQDEGDITYDWRDW